MTKEKLKRVMWLLKELNLSDLNKDIVSLTQIERAIMHEIGTDERTIKRSIALLLKFKWIKRINRHQFRLDKIEEDEVF